MAAKLAATEPTPAPAVVPVQIVPEQPAIAVMQVAPDGVTPVPIASLGAAENTPVGADGPVGTAQGVGANVEPATVAAVPPPAPTGTPGSMTVIAPTPQPNVIKGEGSTLAPTTTEQEDVVTAGQRRINLLWEITQSVIAIGVVFITMIKAYTLPTNASVPTVMAVTLGAVIGFYFARVNHEAIGGVGRKPPQTPYEGR